MAREFTPAHIVALCGLFWGDFATALKISSLKVPDVVLSGQSVKLSCDFDLEGDSLYSVTWWKDTEPFLSFQARFSKLSVFRVAGVHVEERRTNFKEVYLSHVTYRTSGRIGCEVVAESPSFEKDSRWLRMVVVERQRRDPRITGNLGGRRTGDLLLLNCSSSFSYPSATLTWFVNGKEASFATVIVYPPEDDGEGRKSSRSGLQMFLQPHHFHSGVLRLQCRSAILDRFTRHAEVQIYDLDFREPTKQGQVAVSSSAPQIDWCRTSLLVASFFRRVSSRSS